MNNKKYYTQKYGHVTSKTLYDKCVKMQDLQVPDIKVNRITCRLKAYPKTITAKEIIS
jgi:hypothetical protein